MLKKCLCHLAVSVVAVCVPASICSGFLISSFSAYRSNLVECAHCFCLLVLVPRSNWQYQKSHHLLLTKALGMNAQQWEACFWLLQCLQETLLSLQYDFVWLFLPHLRHIGGLLALFGRLVPMAWQCVPCSDFTPSLGTVLSLGGGLGGGVYQLCSSSEFGTGAGWGWGCGWSWGWGWGWGW